MLRLTSQPTFPQATPAISHAVSIEPDISVPEAELLTLSRLSLVSQSMKNPSTKCTKRYIFAIHGLSFVEFFLAVFPIESPTINPDR